MFPGKIKPNQLINLTPSFLQQVNQSVGMNQIRKEKEMKKTYALFIVVLFIIGCAAGRTQIIQPKKVRFQNYQIIEITDFENNVGPDLPAEFCAELPNSIAEKVKELNLFQEVIRSPVVTEGKHERKVLIIKGTVIEYEPGSRGKRYLAGFTGWGKAFMTFQLVAIDKMTQETIFIGNVGAELSGGFFGGGFGGVIEKMAEECTECIQANY